MLEIDNLLTSNILSPEDITKIFCYFLLSIVEDTSDGISEEYPRISFPDSLVDLIKDYLGDRCIIYLKHNLVLEDRILSEVINNIGWINDKLLDEAYDFLKYHIEEVRKQNVRK
jgi:hypothetical protein